MAMFNSNLLNYLRVNHMTCQSSFFTISCDTNKHHQWIVLKSESPVGHNGGLQHPMDFTHPKWIGWCRISQPSTISEVQMLSLIISRAVPGWHPKISRYRGLDRKLSWMCSFQKWCPRRYRYILRYILAWGWTKSSNHLQMFVARNIPGMSQQDMLHYRT